MQKQNGPANNCLLCVKYAIFGSNLSLALFGVTLLVLAIWVRVDARFSQLLSEQYFEVTNGQNLNVRTLYISAYIMLVIGCFLVVTAGAGCCGAIRESLCCLSTYCILLIITALIELGVGVFIFIESDHIEDELGTALDYMVQRYYIGPDILTQAIDALQDGFDCCGNSGCGDYRELHIPLPRSCDLSCDETGPSLLNYHAIALLTAFASLAHNVLQHRQLLFLTDSLSCRIVIYRVLRDSFTVLAIIGLLALAAQVVAIVMAFWLCCHARESLEEVNLMTSDVANCGSDCSDQPELHKQTGNVSGTPQQFVVLTTTPIANNSQAPMYQYHSQLAPVVIQLHQPSYSMQPVQAQYY